MSKDHSSAKPDDPELHGHKHDDDIIVVPKGSNRSRFLMTALLAVLVLTTFTVSGEVVDVLTGRNRAASAYMSWKSPDGTLEEMKQSDFYLQKQSMTKTMALLSGGRSAKEHDDAATAQHILTDRLAQDAGVAVTNEEMSRIILQVFGTLDTYKRRLADYRMSAKSFEETLRSIMRAQRYRMLVSQGFAEPDPEAIEKSWREIHQQVSIETVEVSTESFTAEAETACPAGADLQAWFDALPEFDKSTYRRPTQAKSSAEFVWFSFEPFTRTDRLLEKYPRPAAENPDEVARTWYEANKDLLYLKADLPPGKPRDSGDYKPFEEVQEHARTAGIAYQSLLDWYNDVQLREEKGDRIPLYTEGQGMGLAYRLESTPHTLPEWEGAAMAFKGKAPVLSTFNPASQVEKLLPEVFVDSKGIFIGRLLGREESRVPEFPEIQDKVREGWIKKKTVDLARAKLMALAAKFPEEPDPYDSTVMVHVEPDGAKFLAAATELGLEVKTQDWFDAAALPDPSQKTPFRLFLRGVASRYGKTLGTISPPELPSAEAMAWMGRIAGKRDPDPASMTPLEYQSARSLAAYEARTNFVKNTFHSDDFLKEQYGLDLEIWRRQKEEPASSPK